MSRNVIVAGGGPAALETVLALANERLDLTLISPGEAFVYGPISVAEPFSVTPTRRYPLAQLKTFGVRVLCDRVAEVLPHSRKVRLGSGETLGYDELVLATGATATPAVAGALTFTGPRDVEKMQGLIEELEAGSVKQVAFAAPEKCRWTLPLYELALQTAGRVRELGLEDVELVLVTHEARPLEVFGPAASDLVERLLAEAGIARAERIPPAGRVVALAELTGRAPAGLPTDAEGFIRVDGLGRVAHTTHVYAVGDGASHAIKQGGLATQQADVVARVIMGEHIPLPDYVLRAMLITGGDPIYLRRALHEDASAEVSKRPLWWPPSKIAGAWLAPFLDKLDDEPALERKLTHTRGVIRL